MRHTITPSRHASRTHLLSPKALDTKDRRAPVLVERVRLEAVVAKPESVHISFTSSTRSLSVRSLSGKRVWRRALVATLQASHLDSVSFGAHCEHAEAYRAIDSLPLS